MNSGSLGPELVSGNAILPPVPSTPVGRHWEAHVSPKPGLAGYFHGVMSTRLLMEEVTERGNQEAVSLK